MKRYPRLVQADKRGQIVIPKDVRQALDMDETTGFWVYVIEGQGVLLRKADAPDLTRDETMRSLKDHAQQLGIPEETLRKTIEEYKKEDGGLEEL